MNVRRLKGAFFIATLVAALLMSSGFLAYFAWGPPGSAGSLAALESPVVPPALSGKTAPSVRTGRVAKQIKNDVSAAEGDIASNPDSKSKIEKPEALDHTQTLPTVSQPSLENATFTNTNLQSVKIEDKKPKNSANKKAISKKRKAKRPVETEQEDITRVPPEWNWFDTPLKIEFRDGKVVIEGVRPPSTSDMQQPALRENFPDNMEEAKKSDFEVVLEEPVEHSVDASAQAENSTPVVKRERSSAAVQELSFQKPNLSEAVDNERIAVALARLQARRNLRAEEARKLGVTLPSEGGDASYVPASLLRLVDALNRLVGNPTNNSDGRGGFVSAGSDSDASSVGAMSPAQNR